MLYTNHILKEQVMEQKQSHDSALILTYMLRRFYLNSMVSDLTVAKNQSLFWMNG